MSTARAPRFSLPLHYAGAMLAVFFVVPLAIMLAVSFYHRTVGYYERGFEFDSYIRAGQELYLNALLTSVEFALIASVASVLIAVPFTYLVSRLRPRPQVLTLIFVLCAMSLSEVIVAFGWSIILSRGSGISNIFVWLGLMERPQSWARGYWAVLIGLTYFNLPFAVVMMFPGFSRLNPEVIEASRTLGAGPLTMFRTIVLPLMTCTLLATTLVLFIFTMGALVTPLWLGGPKEWMIANYISDEVMTRSNFPFGAALAMIYFAITIVFLLVVWWLNRRGTAA
ncbi:ABC transporter permease [Oricola sp.]|uniref:ABC transporter permease n=1 Tax=Oricola sp. TaxID=1979950 RepID=UPI003BAB5695